MITKKSILRVLLLPLLMSFGCVGLKHVNDFATAAEKSIAGYNGLPYSYQQHCLDLCKQKYEEDLLSGKATFSPQAAPECDCSKDKNKDSDAYKAYTALTLYFTGLEKLSAGDKFVYKSDDLVKDLTKVKAIGDTSLKAPVTGIANIIINMATTGYREHALKKILEQSKQPVDALLGDLITSNKILEEYYKGYYSRYLRILTIKYSGTQHMDSETQLADFISNNDEVEQAKAVNEKLENFNALLQKVKDAHLKLAQERMNLKDKDLITYLFTQANQLRTNISKL